MSTEGPGWPNGPDDDLDRAFGPETSSVPTRSGAQRVRRGALVLLGVVVAAGVLIVALSTIIGSVQSGVGGVFPQPDAAQARFAAAAGALDGVRSVDAGDTQKTGFASYDVTSTVTVDPDLPAEQQDAVVADLSRAAERTAGNGVHVYAVADLGKLEVGVSADRDVTTRRLAVARQLLAIGGVRGVECGWGTANPTDDPGSQQMTVRTIGRGQALAAVMAKASHAAEEAFPGSTVTAARPGD